MSSFTISEDLRGVLEDVVKEPKQRVFAGTCLQLAAKGFDEVGDLTLTTRTGLSSAERHLLRVHKEELARALLFGFYYNFFAEGGPGRRLNLIGQSEADSSWRRNAEFARNNALPEAFAPGSATWLHRLLKGQSLRTTQEYHELAVAAERLTGSVSARLYRGLNYEVFGRVGRARSIYEDVWRYGKPSDQRAALQQLSAIQVNEGRKDVGFASELQALSLSLRLSHEGWTGVHIARALVLAESSSFLSSAEQDDLVSLAREDEKVIATSLHEIAETHSSQPEWQAIACRILDRFDAAV